MRVIQWIRVVTVAVVLALPGPAAAVQAPASERYLASLQRGVDGGAYRQLAVGWIDHGVRHSRFLARNSPPTADSQFEIGSVTGVFTGLLLAQAAYRHELGMDARLLDTLPQGVTLGDASLASTSLRQLAAHRSGLPVVPPNLFPSTRQDPYADYATGDLLDLLRNWRRAPGSAARARFSPLDSAVLGYILSRELADPFPIVLQDRVLAPLGLSDTGFADTNRLLSGYSRGQPAHHWHYDALAPSAGLRSTLADMLVFLQANLRPEKSPLRAALLLARQGYEHGDGESFGLGWRIVKADSGDNAWPLVWSASRTGGFAAFIGFRTDLQQAVVILDNTDADVTALGLAWLRHLPPPDAPSPYADTRSAPLSDYSGLYEVGDDARLIVRGSSAGLTAQWSGQPVIALYPVGPDVFDGEDSTYALSFQREAGTVNGVVIAHAGFNVLATRLSRRAPHLHRNPVSLPAATLDAAVGNYRLDADTLVHIGTRKDGLFVQLTARPRRALIAYASDRLVTGDGSIDITLQRSARGRVDAISLDLAGTQRLARRISWRSR